MIELLVGGSAWWVLPVAVLVFGVTFGFLPGVMLRLLVLIYPKDDPRRRELVAELYVLGRLKRFEWVFQQLETALFEGLAHRLARRRERRRRWRPGLLHRHAYLSPIFAAVANLVVIWRLWGLLAAAAIVAIMVVTIVAGLAGYVLVRQLRRRRRIRVLMRTEYVGHGLDAQPRK